MDKWQIIKIGEGFRVLAGKYGGYLVEDEWRLSTSIQSYGHERDFIRFITENGNHYLGLARAQGLSTTTVSILQQLMQIDPSIETIDLKQFLNLFEQISGGVQ